jgi:thioesterase domain-containing protein
LDLTEIRPRTPEPAAAADPASVQHLAQLAAHVLEVERVSPHDDLFDLGLDSMTATDLLARAVQAGLAPPGLPTTVFLRHSTPETLATALARGADPTVGHVVPLRESGAMPPLFVVHGHDGRVVLFRALAERLGEDFPVYAFVLPDDVSGLADVQDLASLYATELRRVHPVGPYAVCGLCFGGSVALEMARLLGRAGEPPIVLGLINPLGIEQAFGTRALSLAAYRARRLVHQLRNRTLRRALRAYVRTRRVDRVDLDVRRIQAALDPMRNAYRASPYDGDALVFATSTYTVRERDWTAAVRGDLRWIRLGGRHGEELTEPYVSRIAAVLASQMRARS